MTKGSALSSIFVSYRRKDSQGEAGRLFDDLTSEFGEQSVFMDVSAIEPGRDFRKAIDHSVKTCNVLLALIGQEWLDSTDLQGRRRLDDENDFVRLELASALRRDIPVIPVMLRGAKMPDVDRLPLELNDLAFRNAVELTHARWKSDVQVLLRALRLLLNTPERVEADLQSARSSGVKPAQSTARFATAEGVASLQADVVALMTKELAHYVGPIADLIVRRAAQRCQTLEELLARVEGEIEDQEERRRFTRGFRLRM